VEICPAEHLRPYGSLKRRNRPRREGRPKPPIQQAFPICLPKSRTRPPIRRTSGCCRTVGSRQHPRLRHRPPAPRRRGSRSASSSTSFPPGSSPPRLSAFSLGPVFSCSHIMRRKRPPVPVAVTKAPKSNRRAPVFSSTPMMMPGEPWLKQSCHARLQRQPSQSSPSQRVRQRISPYRWRTVKWSGVRCRGRPLEKRR
jgi:hypothetical protein